MLFKKKYIFFLIFIITFCLFAEETDLAKFYIKKAHAFYKDQKYSVSREFLTKSEEYSKKFPELYYISNQLLPDNKSNMYQKRLNAENIVKSFNNGFLISNYDLLKQSATIFENVREFRKSDELYSRYVLDRNKTKLSDHLAYINMLFKSDLTNKLKKIPERIHKADQIFDSIHLDYFMLLFEVQYKNISDAEFDKKLKILISHNYSPTRVLYLRSIKYNDQKRINEVLGGYNDLHKSNNIESGFSKRILYNILARSANLQQNDIIYLLNQWKAIGNNDQKTIDILRNKKIKSIVNKSEDLKKYFINYTGVRRRDIDEDGNWETHFEYKNGEIVNIVNDHNQDGIYESRETYYDNGKIKNYLDYDADNFDYDKYTFNEKDSSLLNVEIMKNNRLYKRFTMIQSAVFPDTKRLYQLKIKDLIKQVAYEENWEKGYNITNYFNEEKEFEYVDDNNNGIYEKKIFFEKGIINEVLRDINEDGNYETIEIYMKNKLKESMYKTVENLETYDYKEVYYSNKISKYWDNDLDGMYEIYIDEYNNGTVYKMFDIDFDGKYEYLYEYKNSIQKGIYYIENNKHILLKEFNEPLKEKKKNWKIITTKDLKEVETPDNIMIENKRYLSGMFTYDGQKYFFKNGLIKNEFFSYRLFFINNVVYLFEIY